MRPTVVRIITRLNIGGPSIQAARLTTDLSNRGYRTVLIHGRIGAGEGDMSDLLPPGTDHRYVDGLRRPIAPHDDARAFAAIWSILRDVRPDVVHTHMAKAGLLGRLATRLYNRTIGRSRPARLVHTYHGHVLDGYFSPRTTAAFIAAERYLARATDALVAISPRIRDDLVDRFGIGSRDRVHVIPLGFDLRPLAAINSTGRAAARTELGIPAGARVVGSVGRLTAIKNHDLFLKAATVVAAEIPEALFVIAGDGERRVELEEAVDRAGLRAHVRFLGWRRDLPVVYGATDVLALTSRNEGTPVALIEAMAAGVCGVATAVGGVPDVITDPTLGVLVPPDDPRALASALIQLLRADSARETMGARARASVVARYGVERLVDDIDSLYRALLPNAL